ncbi:MAG: hypothetical protein IJ074_04675 [Clostridia bacterium]|nr:hypothetical protein [Clostridia bacterium]
MNATLQEILESDREMLLNALNADRTPQAAIAAISRELDRVQYRFVEQCESARLRDEAQRLLETLRDSLAWIDSIGDCRVWQREPSAQSPLKARMKPVAWAPIGAGAALLLAGMLSMRPSSPIRTLEVLLFALAGGACLWLAGRKSVAPSAPKKRGDEAVRTEYLVDAEKVWHQLRTAIVLADGRLRRMEESTPAEAENIARVAASQPVEDAQIELLSELLEIAYAQKGGDTRAEAEEMIAQIRYYLHGQNIALCDYAPERRSWFELLPARAAGTIRPAIVREDHLLRKGVASE